MSCPYNLRYGYVASTKTMDCEEGLNLSNVAVFASSGRYLTDLESALFTASWNGQTYEDFLNGSSRNPLF
jgi:hypothetical protein